MTHVSTSPRELLEVLVKGLVSTPEDVVVKETQEDARTTVLELSVAQDDYGNVIGRGGRTAGALRTVVKSAAAEQGARVFVDIVDS